MLTISDYQEAKCYNCYIDKTYKIQPQSKCSARRDKYIPRRRM